MSYNVPQEMLEYLHTMITPEDGETLMAFELKTVDWSQYEDNQLHGLICRGDPTPHLDEIWRVLRPGAHIMMFAPEDQPTGHSGACAMEDKGFEIRDAILWVREAGHIHYVPKASSSERNKGCADLAQSRQVATFEYNPKWNHSAAGEVVDADAADMSLEGVKEALLAAGVDDDTVDAVADNGIPESNTPDDLKRYFAKSQEQSKKYGNWHACLHPDALVLTQHGYRPISSIEIGNRVYAADGCFHPVEHVSRHPYTSPDLFEIGVAGTNYKTLASDNHPFLIWRPQRNKKGNILGGEVQWVEASKMQKGDYTMTPVLGEQEKDPHTWDEKLFSVDFWFLFGLYIAEGVLQKAGHGNNVYPSYTLHKDETHLLERIQAFFEPDFNVGVYKKGNTKAVQVMAFDPEAGALFWKLGGRGSSTKSLHPMLWNLDRERRQALLDGYIAGDGGKVRTWLQAKTVSPDLASQLQLLAQSLGYKTNLFRYEGTPGRIGDREFKTVMPEHQIRLYDRNQKISGRKPSKPTMLEWEGVQHHLRYVQEVVPVPYEGDVVNLSVEGSPTFQTAVGMSHNTVKPKALLRRLIEASDIPKDATILDPFMGSGSMGLACLETGHNYIGIEKEEDYIRIADARVRHWNKNRLGHLWADIESEAPQDEKEEEEPMSLDDLFGM